MLGAVRFIWNATRGARLRPWRSPYIKWRMETYSGLKAETIGLREIWQIAWHERRQFLRFLAWTGKMQGYAAASTRQQEIG
ncbi:MAG TPA: hypothetical protein VGB94_00385 [Acidobacteriaceae bacterium]